MMRKTRAGTSISSFTDREMLLFWAPINTGKRPAEKIEREEKHGRVGKERASRNVNGADLIYS